MALTGLTYEERLKNLTETVGPKNDVAEVQELIRKHNWIFAKTYADFCPHEYTLREKGWSDRDYQKFVNHIWKYGLDACYGKQGFKRYWFDHEGGYYYFIFDEDVDNEGNVQNACTLVNRGGIKYFDFWIERDLLGEIVRCKVTRGGPRMAKEDRAREGKA